MTRHLQSYLQGEWRYGNGDAATMLKDAVTGAETAVIDASGMDMEAALAFGRNIGGPALRQMSFHQRALMMKSLALHLLEKKENLYELSYATGATRTDSWIDIEGGIGVLFAYASKGRRELPNRTILVDGAFEPAAKDGGFGGQHILSPLEGVAVHINAYNFPCWGMLEKLAQSWLAGMPALVKPASPGAWLAEALVREIIASDILPEGALQLVCGSVGDLFEHLGCQDTVSFTGSATTGNGLRNHPQIVAQSVRFTMEADSLNASISGADVAPGTPEFDLFIREAHREMTSKAGQKCTAIRRLLVPRAHIDAVADALCRKLASVRIGNPRHADTRMGALAGLEQRREVLDRIGELRQGAAVILDGQEPNDLIDADPEQGAFIAPTLLRCDAPHQTNIVHNCEAFGPVATLMPYDGIDDALALARLGGGSLAASVFTNDKAEARDLAHGLATWHGRILIGNRDTAKNSTGHGSPLPALLHGGPGRAGGGAEMGGIAGIKHFMTRSAIQGSPEMLTEITGRYCPNAPSHEKTHPFRKSLAELEIGDSINSAPRTISMADIEKFAEFTGDKFYAHTDEKAAGASPFFDGIVAHGYLLLSFAAGLFVEPSPGPVLANYGIDNLRFLAPVYPGDSIQVRLTAKEISPRQDNDYGEVRWDAGIVNQNAELVAAYDVLTMVAKSWPGTS